MHANGLSNCLMLLPLPLPPRDHLHFRMVDIGRGLLSHPLCCSLFLRLAFWSLVFCFLVGGTYSSAIFFSSARLCPLSSYRSRVKFISVFVCSGDEQRRWKWQSSPVKEATTVLARPWLYSDVSVGWFSINLCG